MTERGLILRHIPYTDHTVVIRCLTQETGLLALFLRLPKKNRTTGHLQTGAFFQFKADKRPNGHIVVSEHGFDPKMPSEGLKSGSLPLWLFTVELLNKSLRDGMHISGLRAAVDTYYLHLAYEQVSTNPLTPLLITMKALGLMDIETIALGAYAQARKDLSTLGYRLTAPPDDAETERAFFDKTVNLFCLHFGVDTLHSLELL